MKESAGHCSIKKWPVRLSPKFLALIHNTNLVQEPRQSLIGFDSVLVRGPVLVLVIPFEAQLIPEIWVDCRWPGQPRLFGITVSPCRIFLSHGTADHRQEPKKQETVGKPWKTNMSTDTIKLKAECG